MPNNASQNPGNDKKVVTGEEALKDFRRALQSAALKVKKMQAHMEQKKIERQNVEEAQARCRQPQEENDRTQRQEKVNQKHTPKQNIMTVQLNVSEAKIKQSECCEKSVHQNEHQWSTSHAEQNQDDNNGELSSSPCTQEMDEFAPYPGARTNTYDAIIQEFLTIVNSDEQAAKTGEESCQALQDELNALYETPDVPETLEEEEQNHFRINK